MGTNKKRKSYLDKEATIEGHRIPDDGALVHSWLYTGIHMSKLAK